MNKFTPAEFGSLLRSTIPSRLPVLAVSPPGLGKTAIFKQSAKMLGYQCEVIHPSTLDPVDLSGMPVPSNGRIERLLDDLLADIFDSKEPTLLLLDELGQASPAMQAACAPLLLDRRVGKHKLSDKVTVCAATNSRRDKAGAIPILTHIISRMNVIAEVVNHPESWYQWAVSSGIRHEIISFLRFRPKHLLDFNPDKSYADMTAYATPRSWANLSALMDAGLPESLELPAFAGCVGQEATTEFSAHLSMCRSLTDIDEIIRSPHIFKMPKGQAERYAVATAIGMRCSENPGNVLYLIDEMHRQKCAEFAVVALKDALECDHHLSGRKEFVEFARTSPTAKTIIKV